jgi:hypothetical protein
MIWLAHAIPLIATVSRFELVEVHLLLLLGTLMCFTVSNWVASEEAKIPARKSKKNVDKWGIRTPAGKAHENAPVDTGKLALESHAITTMRC